MNLDRYRQLQEISKVICAQPTCHRENLAWSSSDRYEWFLGDPERDLNITMLVWDYGNITNLYLLAEFFSPATKKVIRKALTGSFQVELELVAGALAVFIQTLAKSKEIGLHQAIDLFSKSCQGSHPSRHHSPLKWSR